jgi:hypothetical protein
VHTHDSTITPSAHLPTVEALLEKLDEMKGNVGARQRLEFLLKKGPEVVPGFCFEDAFLTLSRQAHTERVQKFEDLGNAIRVMKARWHDSSLEDDVKQAGDLLIGHLSQFLHQARRKESRFEIETLASLWEDAPDVFPVFGLPTPSYYSSPSRKKDDELEKLTAVKERLVEEIAEENAKEAHIPEDGPKKTAVKRVRYSVPSEEQQLDDARELVGGWMDAHWDHNTLGKLLEEGVPQVMTEGSADGITTGMIEQTKEELEKLEVRVPVKLGNRSYKTTSEYGEVVAEIPLTPGEERMAVDVTDCDSHCFTEGKKKHVLGHIRIDEKGLKLLERRARLENQAPIPHSEELEPELDMLDIRSWTLAINEVLASNWHFDRQLRGRVGDRARMGVTLIWKKGSEVLRLDIERLAGDEVLVRVTPPRSTKRWPLDEVQKMYRSYAKEMKESQLAELHKDPTEFVKLILV